MYLFFLTNSPLFSRSTFKHWASSLYNFRQYRNSEVYRALDTAFTEKFLQLYPEFEVIDIVPICRNMVRGPEFQNGTVLAKLEEFLLTNTQFI